MTSNKSWVLIRVSAYVLYWPRFCACCFGPSDTWITIRHTRIKGVRVRRYQNKNWDIPYCSHCLLHHRLTETASSFRRSAYLAGLNNTLLLIAGIVLLVFGSLTGFCCLVSVVVPLIVNAQPSAKGASVNSNHGYSLLCFIVFPAGLLIASAVVFYKRHIQIPKTKIKKARLLQEVQESLAEAGRLRLAECCPQGIAVIYDGWYGTIHTFRFWNQRYAQAFARANAPKLVR